MLVQFSKVPSEVALAVIAAMSLRVTVRLGTRPAMLPRALLSAYQRGSLSVSREDVLSEVRGEGLADERGVRRALDVRL